jgi:hypothetical protein
MSHSHRPVCVKCQIELRPQRNGVGVLDMAKDEPYQLCEADMYRCPGCGFEVVIGFARTGWEHFEPSFDRQLDRHRQQGTLIYNYEKPRPEPV